MIGDRERNPPVDPSGIELTYTHRHWADGEEDGPEVWHISADAYLDEEDKPVAHVGDIEVVLIDPNDPRNAFEVLDGHSGDLAVIGEAVLDPRDGGLNPELEDHLELAGTRLLILDRVELRPEWRGFGIGVLLAGLAVRRLSGGCLAAVCYPAPVDDVEDQDRAERQAAVAALGRAWSQLGFEHFRNGVYVLDLAFVTLDEAITRLRQRVMAS